MNCAIQTEHLSKRYVLGTPERYRALRDVLARGLQAPIRIFRQANQLERMQAKSQSVWALRDVSLQIQEGEAVGLIGRNGAGKSTLLKILARITQPTEGAAQIQGRIGSLLEIGTGFHPELTGRENVFLSGAVLGMRRNEIVRKFDEIVDFSGVEKFLDTPLKHYSSGMQTRLAFAVAAHLDPEILLIDEVLAVGDLEFQRKCLGKMEQVTRGGRTILFVSHNMGAIRGLCQRVVWIDQASIRAIGGPHETIAAYEASITSGRAEQVRRPGDGCKAQFVGWEIIRSGQQNRFVLQDTLPVSIAFALDVIQRSENVHLGIVLRTVDSQPVWAWCADRLTLEPGIRELRFDFPMLPLRPGPYTWQIGLWDDSSCLDLWHSVPEMLVTMPNHQHPDETWNGQLNMPCEFSLAARETSSTAVPAQLASD